MVKHNLTGANYGVFTWLFQKISAALMLIIFIFFSLVFTYVYMTMYNNAWDVWHYLEGYFVIKFLLQLFFIAMMVNAWVSVRDIWMDYVTCSMLKLRLHILTTIWLFACLIYSIKVIW